MACQPDTKVISPSFYHWKSAFSPSDFEVNALHQLKVKRLYVRYFDLKYSQEKGLVYPEAKVSFDKTIHVSQEIVPVIYITNQAILKTPTGEIELLGQKTLDLLFQLQQKSGFQAFREIQIDCDWNSRSRDRYFQLLAGIGKELRKRNIALSTTIRLHQLKFRKKTGVPPVDRGMLMFYNMGNLNDPQEKNSILNLDLGRTYLEDYQPYPVPLDIALPIFSWGVLHRKGKAIRLLNNLFPDQLEDVPGFKKISKNRVKVGKSRYFRGQYLYKGDVIRMETVQDTALLRAAVFLAETLPQDSIHIALYHLDSLTLRHYELEALATVFDTFHR
ncbi:MAG TPA: hypothetical protein ENJ82_11640 [Bacteroidetes bacterium]|nr:hypothetical protein [Bacteroidota bacterium]